MGWFWSEASQAPPERAPSQRQGRAGPPPSCPMHKTEAATPATPAPSANHPPSASNTPLQSCPVKAPQQATEAPSSRPQASNDNKKASTTSTLSKLNPLNYMPSLSQERAPGQTSTLPTSRETSSIPRGDIESNWEYPSPQQMYNALLRKGFQDTPVDAIESMVAVHNFLNEGAWDEILGWERRFASGLKQGWTNCIEGEERFERRSIIEEARNPALKIEPKLLRLQGRPQDMTPKARVLQMLGWVYPSKFSSDPPFDRHDWFVQRALANGSTREIRYVIDYYSGPPEPTGEPVFFLDVRPAVDTPSAAISRLMRWGGDMWYTASGGSTRVPGRV